MWLNIGFGFVTAAITAVISMAIPWALNKLHKMYPKIIRKIYNDTSFDVKSIPVTLMVNNYLMLAGALSILPYFIRWRDDFIPYISDVPGDIFKVVLMIMTVDGVNYLYHRWSHINKWWYRNHHYLHHASPNPSSFEESTNTEYLDWLISLPINFFPLTLCKLDIVTFSLFGTWIVYQVATNHCGYMIFEIPGLMSPVEHWAHHAYRDCNYCEHTKFFDWLGGTLMNSQDALNKKGITDRPPLVFDGLVWLEYKLFGVPNPAMNFGIVGPYHIIGSIVYTLSNWMRGPLETILWLYDTYKCFGSPFEPIPFKSLYPRAECVLLTNPSHIEKIMSMQITNGEWMNNRVRMVSFFSSKQNRLVDNLYDVMANWTLPHWKAYSDLGIPVDMTEQIQEYCSMVAFKNIFGIGRDDIPGKIIYRMGEMRSRGLFSLPLWVPTASNLRYLNDRDDIYEFIKPLLIGHRSLDTMAGSIIRSKLVRKELLSITELIGYVLKCVPVTVKRMTVADGIETCLKRAKEKKITDIHQLSIFLCREIEKVLGFEFKDSNIALDIANMLCRESFMDTEIENVIMGEICTQLLEMTENISAMIGWTLFEILKSGKTGEFRKYAASLQFKSTEALQSSIPLELPIVDVTKDKTLMNIMKEGLRLHPPVYIGYRKLQSDVEIDPGKIVNSGTLCIFSQFLTQRHKRLWGDDADKFKPERWNTIEPVDGSFFPFESSSHGCPGKFLAMNEAALVLCTLFRNFNVEMNVSNYRPKGETKSFGSGRSEATNYRPEGSAVTSYIGNETGPILRMNKPLIVQLKKI